MLLLLFLNISMLMKIIEDLVYVVVVAVSVTVLYISLCNCEFVSFVVVVLEIYRI